MSALATNLIHRAVFLWIGLGLKLRGQLFTRHDVLIIGCDMLVVSRFPREIIVAVTWFPNQIKMKTTDRLQISDERLEPIFFIWYIGFIEFTKFNGTPVNPILYRANCRIRAPAAECRLNDMNRFQPNTDSMYLQS